MEHLRLGDVRSVNRFLRKGYAIRDVADVPGHVATGLQEVVPAAAISYNEVDPLRRRMRATVQPESTRWLREGERIFAQHLHQHPMLTHYRRTGDGGALKISDFLSRRQFHQLGLYQDYYRLVGTEYQISITLPDPRSLVMAFALSRGHRDFSERDRTVLDLVRPHLVQVRRTAEAVAGLQRELDLLQRAVDERGLGVVALDRDGRVLLMTGLARHGLEERFGRRACANQRLPTEVAQWVASQCSSLAVRDDVRPPLRPCVLDAPHGRLTIHLTLGEGESGLVFLYLEREPLSPTGEVVTIPWLTPREAEVLGWVARGKTNSAIGIILGISEKTVDKHLQHVFVKLGVETRTAAAAVAFQRLESA